MKISSGRDVLQERNHGNGLLMKGELKGKLKREKRGENALKVMCSGSVFR